jgi:hypothetical protein
MTESPIRPMTAGEIISQAFRMFRANLALLVLVAFLPQAVLLVLQHLIARLGDPTPALLLLLLMVTVVAKAITLSAITTVTAGAALGYPPTVTQTYGFTLRNHLVWVVVANVITALLTSVGLLFFIFPGLIIGGYLAPTVPIVVLESRNPFDAIGRSFALMRPELPKGIAIFAFVILMSEVIPLLFHLSLGIGPFSPLLGAVVGSITLPPAYAANAILYFSVRAGEGYTPEVLDAELRNRLG